MKPRDFIHTLENPDAPPLRQHDAGGRALLQLLAHTYYADGKLDDSELAQMRRLVGTDEVTPLLDTLRTEPLDIDGLGRLFPDTQDRDDIVTLVEHAAWRDGEVDGKEFDIIDQLVEKLHIVRD